MGIFDIAPYSPIMGRGIVPSNLDMMLQEMGFGRALTSGVGQGGATHGGSQEGPTNNDSMVGGVTDQSVQSAFGTDVMGAPSPAVGVAFNGTIGPSFGGVPESKSPNMGMTTAMGTDYSAAIGTPNPNNNTNPANSGWGATVTNVAGVPVGQPQAPTKSTTTTPMGLPAATVMNAPTQAVNSPTTGLNVGTDYGGQTDPQGPAGAGNPGAATAPDQDQTGGLGAGSTAGMGMAHSGVTESGDRGFGGPTGGGGGDGGGGNPGGGPNGAGNPGDAGSGTAGAGQSGEGGQWHTGSWGPIKGPDPMARGEDIPDQTLKEGEAVTSNKLTSDLGEVFFKTMEAAARKGLSRAQIRALGRALLED